MSSKLSDESVAAVLSAIREILVPIIATHPSKSAILARIAQVEIGAHASGTPSGDVALQFVQSIRNKVADTAPSSPS